MQTLPSESEQTDTDRAETSLVELIEHAAHLLPSQGPIEVFVHHNTLHAFEHLDFAAGVQAGGRLYGCHAYLPEAIYRDKLQQGRIRSEDLAAVLEEDLADDADQLIANFGTRHALRLAMLQFPLHSGSSQELRWVVAETDALRKFRPEVEPSVRRQMIEQTRELVLSQTRDKQLQNEPEESNRIAEMLKTFRNAFPDTWNEATWEAFVLNSLWRICCDGVREAYAVSPAKPSDLDQNNKGDRPRHRDVLLDACGVDSDLLVHEVLIRFSSAFLDQGFADWGLPDQNLGLYESFLQLYSKKWTGPTRWFAKLEKETRRLLDAGMTPLESIEESFASLGVSQQEREHFITQTLLSLRGWAGMIWQLETNAEWAQRPAPAGSLVEYLAISLLLDRLALETVAEESLGYTGNLAEVRERFARNEQTSAQDQLDQRSFVVFQLAQVRGWKPGNLQSLSREQWATLVGEIEAFNGLERRRIYHLAYERKYRNETLDAVIAHSRRINSAKEVSRNFAEETRSSQINCSLTASTPLSQGTQRHSPPAYQMVFCIDDREESFRRHLEEIDPACETFGLAGFYGVAMFYRGSTDAHFKPLCPVGVKPAHFVTEEPLYSLRQSEEIRSLARQRIGRVQHRAHLETRTFLGGILTGLFGSLAAFPLVGRVLFPHATARLRNRINRLVRPPSTELHLERIEADPGANNGHLGYAIEEMANIVQGGLKAIGLVHKTQFSPLIIMTGHGSSSLNNPHESAYNCGACSGARGGPNARAFSQMANDPRVRRILQNRGLVIPDNTRFLGAYHNTCDDSLTWFDLDLLPIPHRQLYEQFRVSLDETRRRNAHERSRRFESVALTVSPEEALREVQGRSQDLSEARPEYNHATNALCFVGRRSWSRGLFLDRRAFLTSYDPTADDDRGTILEGLLRAVIPVCAGISLEYYFSTVDTEHYGCGSKLPHNITSLLGVMSGASSDLRPGLSAQMVEIHEPVRITFVIESTPEAMQRIIEENPAIERLVKGDWVQLALFGPATSQISRYRSGEFVTYQPHQKEIPTVSSSIDWYRGCREHLGFASIDSTLDDQHASASGADE